MFTGLVEELGRVERATPADGGRSFTVKGAEVCGDLAVGDSVAINGACQTVTAIHGDRFDFYAMGETLRATNLGELEPGALVNLERALTPGSRLGGHFVTGHVDGVARIEAIHEERGWQRIALELPRELGEELVPKGSIAVDGISLTLGPELGAGGERCELFIIPHTLAHTTLGEAKAGDRVNIETDLLGKYVLRFLRRGEDGDEQLMRLLQEGGFLGGARSEE